MSGIERDPKDRIVEIAADLNVIGEVITGVAKNAEPSDQQLLLQTWLRLQFNVGYVCGENGRLRRHAESAPPAAADSKFDKG